MRRWFISCCAVWHVTRLWPCKLHHSQVDITSKTPSEVNSPGGLPPGVTLANIERKHVLRNPLIANYLYDIFYIEKWGTGIARMRRLMREHELAEPHLEDLDDFFGVTFYGPGDRILDLILEEGVTDRLAEPLGFAQDRRSRRSLRALGLNERQIEALRLMVNEGQELSNAEYRRFVNRRLPDYQIGEEIHVQTVFLCRVFERGECLQLGHCCPSSQQGVGTQPIKRQRPGDEPGRCRFTRARAPWVGAPFGCRGTDLNCRLPDFQ